MNEIVLIIIAIILFFFGYEIRPWVVTKYPESRYLVDLMVMAVTITTILIQLISLITSGTVFFGSYFIVLYILTGYLIYYGFFKHRNELRGKSRKVVVGFSAIYAYIFIASGVLMIWVAPFMSNIKL